MASPSPRMVSAPSGPIYLSSPAYALGELQEISTLTEVPEAVRERLLADGLRKYARANESVLSLLRRSIAETFRKSPVDRGSVGLVVFASISGWILSELRLAAQELLNEFELPHAFPLLVSLADCANFHSAVAVAVDAIGAGRSDSVLLVTIDLVPPSLDRVVPPSIGVLSDGAASCLITRRQCSGLRIEWLHAANDATLARLDPNRDQMRYFVANNRGLERVVRDALQAAELNGADFARVIFNNYNAPVAKMTALTGGFRPEAVFSENIGRVGHVAAADNLVNLTDSLEARPPVSGELGFLLGTGQTAWAAMILRAE